MAEIDTAKLSVPLSINQIDFRVQSINKGGYATILAYKDARVDMRRLNEVYGVGFWQRKHEWINDKEYCSVGVFNPEINEWAWIQDVGTASKTEAEKGQSSDAFKRACFNLGIGLELYDYPAIHVKLKDDEWKIDNGYPKGTWKLRPNNWVWFSQFNEKGVLTYLASKDESGLRFQFGEYSND